eukprot:3304746-Amphidinium_carterae.1
MGGSSYELCAFHLLLCSALIARRSTADSTKSATWSLARDCHYHLTSSNPNIRDRAHEHK